MSAGSKMVSAVKGEPYETGCLDTSFCHFPCLKSLGNQLHPSSTVDIETVDNKASITLTAVHKEHEGVYTVRLRTWNSVQEHGAYVYVKGENQR